MSDPSHLQTLFSAIDEGYCLCEMIEDDEGNPVDYRFLEVNGLFEQMTGLGDAAGRTALDLVPGLERAWVETYARVAAGEVMRFQSGSETMGRVFDVFATPVRPQGRFALVFRDITAQRRAEAEREAARARAEQLLTELNHRVMNTLAMIASIMRMERRQLDAADPSAEVIARMQVRLQAVTELYRALSGAEAEVEVPASAYLTRVAAALSEAIADNGRITITSEIADLSLPTSQAAPLGLIVNELVTNALKYAFPGDRAGTIRIALRQGAAGMLELSVRDDGIGTAAAETMTGDLHGTGTGAMLVNAFAAQLDGSLRQDSCAAGTTVTLTFPDLSQAARDAA